MITINNIVDDIREYFQAHLLVKEFTFGQIEVMDLQKKTLFPVIHLTPGTASFTKGVMSYSFDITCASLLHSELDVTLGSPVPSGSITGTKELKIQNLLSDTLRILTDLDAELRHGFLYMKYKDQYQVSLPISFEPFIEEYKNVLCGWGGTIQIDVDYKGSACDQPLPEVPPYDTTYVGTPKSGPGPKSK